MKQVDFYSRTIDGDLTYEGSIGYDGKKIISTPNLQDLRRVVVPDYITKKHPNIKGYVYADRDPILFLKLLRYVRSNEYSYVTEVRE